jgi:hypothetical protein
MSRKLSTITGIKPDFRTFEDTDKLILSRCCVGIEIEAENIRNLPKISNAVTFWENVSDGSLRGNSNEFIFAMPLKGADIITALTELETAIDKYCPNIDMSARTSLHVHIDVRNYNTKQLLNYILLFMIFERVLFSYVGEERAYSNFCTPLCDCKETVYRLSSLLSDNQESIHRCLSSQGKYASMNISSVSRHGSVEFRMHKGTYKSDEIIKWINILMCVKNYINNYKGDSQELIDNVCNRGIGFFIDVFNKYTSYFTLSEEFILEYMLEGARAAQEVYNSEAIEKARITIKQVASSKSLYSKLYKPVKVNKEEPNQPEIFDPGEYYRDITAGLRGINTVGAVRRNPGWLDVFPNTNARTDDEEDTTNNS